MWEESLKSLVNAVSLWSRTAGLECKSFKPEAGEALLELDGRNGQRFFLEPAEFDAGQVPSTVWFYSYPTMRRVRLVGHSGEWFLQSSDGVPFHKEFNEQTFLELIKDLGDPVARTA